MPRYANARSWRPAARFAGRRSTSSPERGFTHVTVEDIAEAADVSPRTFFNYFQSKEAALFGADPEQIPELRERIMQVAPGEPALEALRMIMVTDA